MIMYWLKSCNYNFKYMRRRLLFGIFPNTLVPSGSEFDVIVVRSCTIFLSTLNVIINSLRFLRVLARGQSIEEEFEKVVI